MKNLFMTLLVVAAAGIIVLVVEYHFFRDNPSSISSDSQKPITSNETLTNQPSRDDRSMPQDEKEPEASISVENNSLSEKLSKMYDTAKSISYDTSARNKALREVVDLAVDSKDYAFATEVAKEISYDTAAKNDALEKIVICACDNEDFEIANKVTDEISYDENRKNQNRQRIMDAMKRNLRSQ